jgi:hypothetical protein
MHLRLQYDWLDGVNWIAIGIMFVWVLFAAIFGYFRFAADDTTAAFACGVAVIVVAYVILALLFNRTILLVSPERIEIAIEPIPWFGAKEVEVADIQYIKVEESSTREGATKIQCLFVLANDQEVPIFRGVPINGSKRAMAMMRKITGWLAPFKAIEIRTD